MKNYRLSGEWGLLIKNYELGITNWKLEIKNRWGMKKDNVIVDKSYKFALRIVKLYKFLCKESNDYIISKQVLRSGTSIGANIEEAVGAQSDRDFVSKLSIAYKEARETHYWLRILRDSEYLNQKFADSIIHDCEELLKIIGSIQKTMKQKINY